MNSITETGHGKNIANLGVIISYCETYVPAYNPSNEDLKISALNNLQTNAQEAMQNLINSKYDLEQTVYQRQIAFGSIKITATRIVNALLAANAPTKVIASAKSINAKIQGHRVNTKTDPTDETRRISVSQQSYDSLIENFSNLIALIATEDTYGPNEPELKIDALENYLDNLRDTNTEVLEANAEHNKLLIIRDELLYAPNTGLVDIALATKAYVKSLFGSQSPQFIQISKIKFTRKTYKPRFTPIIENLETKNEE